ncbi:adenylosuccinate synthetase [Candidatus Marsarchaeota G2 archaeon ECH_B_SAG-G16]|uniref:Adenylosuccinate synthetase n=5 Tax=Candidatus Marsarchaeota TaxID=1978152 RepID=A0A2R6AER9_9ARCH|nr:MAG: adenylosuccinate synthetase [Candidatus Marsarchaeota G1 archaeon OSP_D]PSN84839.1 MAG: adenylosuccinate synthetase [Candidatus Marsarchaeota G1 archaeon BE_D]PSN89320.1 MAG: adenylosuccinate synthetase [Candidatus Marsarchaeota G1 archaeon OSP_C]PSN95362.1 MAG: adenylosuccinate synthetase [Candidatus Marsarchaeota G1 archaeon OSP_B]PSO04556.1 MAG: adenylosuccinate synthetase [Candidatus Marsarchaeota G2 archaeon ECH_B_SAG-G16]
MGVTVVVGGFFGDEGKGKIIAFHSLKTRPSIAVRGGVGPNAGHTVSIGGRVYRLRLVPSAFVNESTRLLIGPGVLVDEEVFLKEVEQLGVSDRINVDQKCGLIEKAHIERDRSSEHLRNTIGTTGTGTGPAMEDRVSRRLRLALESSLLKPYLKDTVEIIHQVIEKGEKVLAEGTQGTFLSLYHGTYPYVTSKDVTAASVCADIGVGPKHVDDVLVVFKSYVTRVGNGPLENELSQEEIEKRGWVERGSVTGRLRRAAPFNFELAKRAVKLNSATCCAITKLDALFPEIKGVKKKEALTQEALGFVKKVEDELGIPVVYVGTGEDVMDTVCF